MSDWIDVRLGDLIKIKSGFSYKGEFIGKGDAFLLGMGCVSYNKKFLYSGARNYSGIFSDSYTANPGDIVLATRQQSDNLPILGMPAILPVDFKDKKVVVGTNLYKVENNSEISNDFIYWLMKSPAYQRHILSSAKGTTVKMITKDAVESFRFKCPSKEERDLISQTLNHIEDKIELNNKINQELESLAQLLFKRWFVDFEFPNENGEPYKSSGGEMVDSELGEIPKRWAVKFLSDVANITIGRTPPRQEHQWFSTDNKDIKWVSIRDMGICGSYIYSTAEYLTKEAVTKFNIPVIKSNTVILSFKLTVGRVSITTEDMLSNEAIAHFNLIDAAIYPELLYLYFKHFNFDSLGSTSSIATAVNSKSIKTMSLIYPASEKLIEFKNAIQPIFSKIKVLTFENKELIELRDTILPKLISGELQINNN
jgi:type I restriction enzyme S subunit